VKIDGRFCNLDNGHLNMEFQFSSVVRIQNFAQADSTFVFMNMGETFYAVRISPKPAIKVSVSRKPHQEAVSAWKNVPTHGHNVATNFAWIV